MTLEQAPVSEPATGFPRRQIDLVRWRNQLGQLKARYQSAAPFPHGVLPDFLTPDVAQAVLSEFPPPGSDSWIQYKHYNENTLGKSDRQQFPPRIGALIDELNSPEFVAFISELTGIPHLIADPHLEGGGLHQTEAGGYLRVHLDFSHHHRQHHWKRRCNLILYLNPDWQPDWGGSLELWDQNLSHCVAKYLPLFNQALVFTTSEISFHGYAAPLACPPGTTRKSLAVYYYTVDQAPKHRATRYVSTAGEGLKAVLVWLDNKAVGLYSVLKERFGLSDERVSKILGWLSRLRAGK